MLEQNIKSVIGSQPAITALIGTRSYPVILPTAPTLPALTFQIVGSSSYQTLTSAGMQRIRLQIDCWGQSYASAVTLRDAVVTSLDGYQDQDLQMLLLSKVDYFEKDALQYRALVEFYVLTTDF